MTDKLKAPVVITAHSNADFDALAAMIAARKLYPGSVLIFPGSQEKNLRDFFIQSTTYLLDFHAYKDIDPNSVQILVVVDTRQKSRLPHVADLLDKEDLTVHAYDHHPDTDEDLQAEYSLVYPWGSTTAILTEMIQENSLEVSADEATIMGLGLYEDTGCFTFSSTTDHDLAAAAWLRTRGMDVNIISDLINRELNAEQISILNRLLESATSHEINGVEVVLTKVSTDRYVGDFALLVHKMVDMQNLRVIFALGRMQDRIHLVARSRTAEVDVGQICTSLGGGGHSYAASATIKDKTLTQVQDELFGLLYSHINPQILVRSLMSSPAVVIAKNKTIQQAIELMTRFGLKTLPVVEEENSKKCVGLLDHQLADKAQSHGLGEMEIREYMLREFSQVTPDTDLYPVMESILGHRQRLVPVHEQGQIMGVLTRTDLINTLVEEPARIPESLFPERKRERNISSLLKNRLPEEVYTLLHKSGELADELNFRIYAVGGFVRDILLHRPNFDLDLVVEGDGIVFASNLADRLGGRVRSHQKFKTAVVILPDEQRIDVATARLEYYEHPAALPTVALSSIKMDLFRRDFTVNALAVQLNPEKFGRLVDFFGGQEDIKDRTLRVLHSLSFVEDPTRILRAIRFESRFDFKIGGQTERLIKNAVHLNMFHKLSGSRIMQELKLILEEENPLTCLKRMEKFHLLESIHPLLILDQHKENVLEEISKVLNWYKLLYIEPLPQIWIVYCLGLFFRFNSDQVRMLTRRLNFTPKQEAFFISIRQEVYNTSEKLYRWSKEEGSVSNLYFILHPLPLEGTLYLMARIQNEDLRKNISHFLTQLKDQKPDITGADLKEMGLPTGPVYSQILKRVLAAKLDGLACERRTQLELAQELVQAYMHAQQAEESSFQETS
jgi:tRNA nucleotidyltransferase (CCA-adding enzyme)